MRTRAERGHSGWTSGDCGHLSDDRSESGDVAPRRGDVMASVKQVVCGGRKLRSVGEWDNTDESTKQNKNRKELDKPLLHDY